jgi:hypothetical protein
MSGSRTTRARWPPWERFMALVPKGEDRDRVAELVARARSKQPTR